VFANLPESAAWRHQEARDGFEVVFPGAARGGYRFDGGTTAVETGDAWAVRYSIELAADWTTRRARIAGRSATGSHELDVEADGAGRWRLNGASAPQLDGCLDLDLESSALTNAFPVHRLALAAGEWADAPAAWVRALDLSVERLEQRYERLEDDGGAQRFAYASPAFGFESVLVYDESGLVRDYPGIAVRAG
jgi:uncharacterized protein